jgi:hypothetical protein
LSTLDRIKTALDVMRALQDVAETAADAELNRSVADAYAAVARAYEEAIDLRAENDRLRRQVDDDSERKALRRTLRREGEVYRLQDPPEGYHPGPFCMHCADADDRFISLIPSGNRECLTCPHCEWTVDRPDARRPNTGSLQHDEDFDP